MEKFLTFLLQNCNAFVHCLQYRQVNAGLSSEGKLPALQRKHSTSQPEISSLFIFFACNIFLPGSITLEILQQNLRELSGETSVKLSTVQVPAKYRCREKILKSIFRMISCGQEI